MFNSARLKLTAWYLLLIMLISGAFSLVIYRVQSNELERFASLQRLRIERRFVQDETPLPLPPMPYPELVAETEQRLALSLLMINGIILIFAGGVGYFLAGRTLKPIAEMVDEQNQFISDASHELRTPLTSLKIAMEVHLRDKDFTVKDTRTLIADSLGEVNRLQSLAEGLLKLAREERPKFEQVKLSKIISQALSRIKPIAKQKGVVLSNKMTESEIFGDQFELTDLLVILLDNAIKYSQPGSTVIVSSKRTDGSVVVNVEDSGMGIDEKDRPHIFDRFYRGDLARGKSGSGGYGLGLSIAKKIVDAHHGTISVASQPNKGTTFTVHLPAFS